MLTFKGSANLCRIVVLNPKGGSGKTTLAFNLAGYLASTGRRVAIVDMDRQGSSMRWLQNRSPELPDITGISADASVLILRDRVEDTFRRIRNSTGLDGWAVKDSGPDYAVFARDGEEVRLVLNEDFER